MCTVVSEGIIKPVFCINVTTIILLGKREKYMKIKKVQSACLILSCIVATGLIGCGETDKRPV